MEIQHFYDPATSTLTYVVHDPASRDAIVIDPVLDYDPAGALTSTASVEHVAAYVRERGLRLRYVLETHAHADHLSASQYLRRQFDAHIAIGAGITQVQETFKELFDLPALPTDGSQFDHLLEDGEILHAGTLAIEAIATPGHTPACMTFKIEDAIFTGDALFIEDQGVGRCDFPRGSAATLYQSVHDRLYRLPDATRVFVGHDYQPNGRAMRYETTLGAEKRENVHIKAATRPEEFIRFRNERDAKLDAPRLLFPSVQVNVDAGRLPQPRANGRRYLSIPFNVLKRADEVGKRL